MPFPELFAPAMALSRIGLQRVRAVNMTRPTGFEVTMGRLPSGPRNASQQPDVSAPFPERNRAEPSLTGEGRRQLSSDTVQDIGRSLEVLNEAMNTGATLDRISTLTNLVRPSTFTFRHWRPDLPIQADRMLASIEVPQTANARTVHPFSRSPTPPDQPLPHPFSGSRSRPQPTDPSHFPGDVASDDDMPELQSISNSSEEEYESDPFDDNGEDSDSERGPAFGTPEWQDYILAHFSGTAATDATGPSTPDVDAPPPLIPISETQSSIGLDPPTPIPEDDSLVHPTALTTPSPPPPFVTDGRGRVVWTSADSASSLQSSVDCPSPSVTPAAVTLAEAALHVPAPTTSPNTSSRVRAAGSPSSGVKSVANPPVTVPSELRTEVRAMAVEVSSETAPDAPPSLLHPQDRDAGMG